MIALVRIALSRPYTFVVLALLLLIVGPLAALRTPTDIFPNINIPVVSILLNYGGLNPQEMSDRIVSQTERALTTTVDDIQHSESQSLNGIAVVKALNGTISPRSLRTCSAATSSGPTRWVASACTNTRSTAPSCTKSLT